MIMMGSESKGKSLEGLLRATPAHQCLGGIEIVRKKVQDTLSVRASVRPSPLKYIAVILSEFCTLFLWPIRF